MRIVVSMGTTIRISGGIDRNEPDPTAPTSPGVRWIGMVTATWDHDGQARRSMAAILKVDSGGAAPIDGWGPNLPALRWIGDAPHPEVARSVYDVIRDRGSHPGAVDTAIVSSPASPSSPSYRPIQVSASP